MIRVMIAGSFDAVRHGLKGILEQQPDIRVSDEARSVQEVFKKCDQRNCDVLILDFDMQRQGSLEILKKLAPQCPTVPIVVMSIHSEEQVAHRVLTAGAKRFLAKDSISETVVQAVRKTFEEERFDSQALARRIEPLDA